MRRVLVAVPSLSPPNSPDEAFQGCWNSSPFILCCIEVVGLGWCVLEQRKNQRPDCSPTFLQETSNYRLLNKAVFWNTSLSEIKLIICASVTALPQPQFSQWIHLENTWNIHFRVLQQATDSMWHLCLFSYLLTNLINPRIIEWWYKIEVELSRKAKDYCRDCAAQFHFMLLRIVSRQNLAFAGK